MKTNKKSEKLLFYPFSDLQNMLQLFFLFKQHKFHLSQEFSKYKIIFEKKRRSFHTFAHLLPQDAFSPKQMSRYNDTKSSHTINKYLLSRSNNGFFSKRKHEIHERLTIQRKKNVRNKHSRVLFSIISSEKQWLS